MTAPVKTLRKAATAAPANQDPDLERSWIGFVFCGDPKAVVPVIRETGIRPEHLFSGSAAAAMSVACTAIRDGRPPTIGEVSGFNPALGAWLRDELAAWYAGPDALRTGGIVARENARRLISLARDRTTLRELDRARGFVDAGKPTADLATHLQDLAAEILRGDDDAPQADRGIGLAEILQPIPPHRYIVPAISLAPGYPTMIAGTFFSAKTMSVQSLAVSLVAGAPLWGVYSIPKRLRVAHWDYEQGALLTRERYQRLAFGHGVDLREHVERDALRLLTVPPLLSQAGAEARIARAAEGFDLVIVDSLRAATPGNDENASSAREPLDLLGRVSERTGAAFLVLHHSGKPSPDRTVKFAARGSSGLSDAVQSLFVFEGTKGEPVKVSHEKERLTGITCDPFGLRVVDVEGPAGPRQGVRVEHVDGAELSDTGAALSTHLGVMNRVVEAIREAGEVAGIHALVARVGGRRSSVASALGELIAKGTVENAGTTARPRLRLPEGEERS